MNLRNLLRAGYGALISPVNSLFARKLNLGGGPRFIAFLWRNLDGASSAWNPVPFKFSPQCEFPFPNARFKIVYSSHMLEHLNEGTTTRVLLEAYRVTEAEGLLILKVPDFELVLEKWWLCDEQFFSDEYWNIGSVARTWSSRSIPDDIDHRASMIFCGYWNSALSDHFSGGDQVGDDPYHGPARLPPSELKQLLTRGEPSRIASTLRQWVIANEKEYTFNHQSAWSAAELQKIVENAGFKVKNVQTAKVPAGLKRIPGIDEMADVSIYLVAQKAKQ